MKNIILFAAILLICSTFSQAQVAINSDGSGPNASAMLDVKSGNKGILIPRMTSTERGLIAGPATGLLVYQTNTPAGYYYFNGTSWKQMIDAASSGSNPVSGSLLSFDGTNWVSKNILVNPAGLSQPVSIRNPYLCLNYCISLYGIFPQQSGIDPFIGEIELFAFAFIPNGWALCNGQLISIAENSALFALIGTTYGGDGVTTFALPDLRGRTPIGQGQGPGLYSQTVGNFAGSEFITISPQQLPAHTHTITLQ
jgi:microcystin-dependent protein